MSSPALKLLALDAALNNIGYVLFNMPEFGVIEPVTAGLVQQDVEKDKRMYVQEYNVRRVEQIYNEMTALLRRLEPDCMAMELLSGSQSAQTSFCFGMVTGVMGCLRAATGIPMQYINAGVVKKDFTGSKTATKDAMLEQLLQLSPDFCDAFLPKNKRKTRGSSAFVRHGLLNEGEHIVDAFAIGYSAANSQATQDLFALRRSLDH